MNCWRQQLIIELQIEWRIKLSLMAGFIGGFISLKLLINWSIKQQPLSTNQSSKSIKMNEMNCWRQQLIEFSWMIADCCWMKRLDWSISNFSLFVLLISGYSLCSFLLKSIWIQLKANAQIKWIQDCFTAMNK